MALSHTITINWSNGSSNLVNTVTLTGQIELNISESIAASTTNLAFPSFQFTLAKLQSCYIAAAGVLVLKTNSSSAPQDTITTAAADPIVWYTGGGLPALFAGSVTNLFVSNASATTAYQLDIRALVISP